MRLVSHFNSIKVQLEPCRAITIPAPLAHFNSIKVQLEPEVLKNLQYGVDNFNSIKVQLERPSSVAASTPLAFQFHKGTIRTAKQKVYPTWNAISIP